MSDYASRFRDEEDAHETERGYARATTAAEEQEEEEESVLVFEFLKRKRPLPSARRLDLMLSVPPRSLLLSTSLVG